MKPKAITLGEVSQTGERQILPDISYVWNLNKQTNKQKNPQFEKVEMWLPGAGVLGNGRYIV